MNGLKNLLSLATRIIPSARPLPVLNVIRLLRISSKQLFIFYTLGKGANVSRPAVNKLHAAAIGNWIGN